MPRPLDRPTLLEALRRLDALVESPAHLIVGGGAELDLAPDWLNPYFETYAHVLPRDYGTRLRPIFAGDTLRVDALGPEDLLVMKCFAARDKDRPHARRLLQVATDLDVVDRQLSHLIDRGYPKAERAADYFDDLRDEAGR